MAYHHVNGGVTALATASAISVPITDQAMVVATAASWTPIWASMS